MKKRYPFILSASFFGLLLIYGGALFVQSTLMLSRQSDPGWISNPIGNQVIVGRAISMEAAALLRSGDVVLTINNQPISNDFDVAETFRRIEPATGYTMKVRRAGRTVDLVLASQPIPTRSVIVGIATRIIIPNIFLLTGLVVFLLKPDDKQARLLALMFGMFPGLILALVPGFAGRPAWLMLVMLIVNLTSLFLPAVFLHFFQIFPEPSALIRKHPRFERLLYVPHLIAFFPYFAILNLLAAFVPRQYYEFRDSYPLVERTGFAVMTFYIVGGLLSLMWNYRDAGRVSRRKMRVVVAGSIAGFLPLFLVIIIAVLFSPPPQQLQLAMVVAIFCFPLFPLAFAYAIIRHRVIPVRLILRRGVRYLLVSRGFIIVQALVVFLVLSFLLTGARLEYIDRYGPRADIVATMMATAIAIGVLTIVNQRVLPIIDRKFFREAYDAQQLLSGLGLEMRRVTHVRQIIDLALEKIQGALHVENVTAFLIDRASGDYRCVMRSRLQEDGARTLDVERQLVLPGDGYAAIRLRMSATVLGVDMNRSWGQGFPTTNVAALESRRREREALREMGTELLIPIATKDELLGMLSLGKRLGDLPYSNDDRQLLLALTFQAAFAIQNAELVQQAAEEERLRHELEIATAVQRRLFPAAPPDLGSLDLAGICHPARGVGGDYYDFLLLDGDRVGIAVADVAGKGISAALLMSTVQASLRSQAPQVNGRLTDLVSAMNRLLHFSTDAASYATFFYAQYDPSRQLLTYVNAGHNPPLLVRAATVSKAHGATASRATHGGKPEPTATADDEQRVVNISELTCGGPIIGAFENCRYEQEAITLQSGDILIAYTDGLSEAFNAAGEEFGEARLREIASTSAHLSAQELTDRIVSRVHEWSGETPQYDDLTLVVMKVK
ncbi:MAG TPA: SpoIIE family protein phosphatase [Blastocatellia bacterium]|nr:SpoIIE family protein phosphatase [Blastocatellia bacterium]